MAIESSNWYLNEGSQIEFLASQFAMSQVINEQTHILDNSKSCIDLIFTSQPNMIIDSGVHPSLHPNCHHQIIVIYLCIHGKCSPWDYVTMTLDVRLFKV